MKYCIKYNIKYTEAEIDPFDEIIIKYNRDPQVMKEYIQEHQKQRIIIYCNALEAVRVTISMKKAEPQLSFSIVMPYDIWGAAATQELKDFNIPFFFDLFAFTYDILNGLVALGVSDIYVGADLGFELDRVKEIAKDINIRCYPDIGQSTFDQTPDLKKFFIRPEDVDLYGQYVDTFEMIEKPIVKRKIYEKRKWYGELNEIIETFKEDDKIDNRFLISAFGECRLTCGKRCMRKGKCHVCESALALAEVLEDNNLTIVRQDLKKED